MTREQLTEYARQHVTDRPKAYAIKINGVYIKKDTYNYSFKRMWSSRAAAWQALQLIIGWGKEVNPLITQYIDEGFIEIVEITNG